MNDSIMLFIPMYNCENQIRRVLEKFDEVTQKLFAEIVIIDNGSTDKSVEVASEILSSFKTKASILKNNENYNLGGSHKVAFNYAQENNYQYCAIIHGDDQGEISDIVKCINSGDYRNYDCYLGARFEKGAKLIGYPAFKIFGNIVLNILCSMATRTIVKDMGGGLNIFNMDYLKNRFYLYFPNNLTFNVYMLFYIIYSKASYKYFPLTWKEEDQVSNAKMFKQAFIIFNLMWDYVKSAKNLFALEENEYSKINYSSTVAFQVNNLVNQP